MKWFKHLSSAYTDLAIRQLIEEFGIEGYGVYWLCCELVAQQGKGFKLKKKQNWFKLLCLISKLNEKKCSEMLQKMSELNLICPRAYKKGTIYLHKMNKYADEYTYKVQRKSGQYQDNVPLDKIRIDKSIVSKTDNKPFSLEEKLSLMEKDKKRHIQIIALYWKFKKIKAENENQYQTLLKRELKPAQRLVGFKNKKILEVMSWLENENTFKWTLETVLKYISEDLSQIKPIK